MSAALEQQNAALRQRLADLERKMKTPLSEEARNEIARAQSRADAVERAFGRNDASCLGHVPGETPLEYRRRLVRNFQQYSPKWKNARVEAMGYDTIGNIEDQVYQDAAQAARNPENYPPGTLHAIKERDESGREVTRWVGDNMAWMQFFMIPGRTGKINSPADIARWKAQ
jgi:hypothetical protein